tara:strand:+ start:114 stop:566 length:453 start_codon:yes stop_codon:yes gene_type:complete
MIITCPSCKKKFNLNDNLVPENGRTLQCGSCNYNWFFKKTYKQEIEEHIKSNEPSEKKIKEIYINEEVNTNINQNKDKYIERINSQTLSFNFSKIFNYFIVSIISFVALIIFLDTFKYNLNSIFPNLELFLYNLFESIKDLKLFINDLLR